MCTRQEPPGGCCTRLHGSQCAQFRSHQGAVIHACTAASVHKAGVTRGLLYTPARPPVCTRQEPPGGCYTRLHDSQYAQGRSHQWAKSTGLNLLACTCCTRWDIGHHMCNLHVSCMMCKVQANAAMPTAICVCRVFIRMHVLWSDGCSRPRAAQQQQQYVTTSMSQDVELIDHNDYSGNVRRWM